MPIKPKHTLGYGPAASRLFTDRDDFQELFHKALSAARSADPHMIVYYGVGGVGKTSLRRKLCETLDSDPGAVYSVVDFDIPAHRGQETALSVLRREFRSRHKVPFNTFDIAYAVYWQKAKPDVTLQKDTFPFWEEGTIVADLVALLGDTPAVGWIPKLAKMAGKGSRLIEEWWTKRGNEELRGLYALDAVQIAERLPMFWAADVRDYLITKGMRGVVFLDTYEALTEGERSEGKLLQRDAWVRELVAQLPEVLWVICGREKLRWAEMDADWVKCLDQHLVGNLASSDAEQFLVSCGINVSEIRAAIVEGSQGLPYYLDLAVDTYMQIKQAAGRDPSPADFAKTPTDVFARLLRHLTQAEVETLKALSIPRFWTQPIFELLVSKFQTGYPLTAFADLCRFSFIDEDTATGTWTMHQLMRDSLQEHIRADLKPRVHEVLFKWYDSSLGRVNPRGITLANQADLGEALYHAQSWVDPQEFLDWFSRATAVFYDAGCWRLLMPMWNEVTVTLARELGPAHPDAARSLVWFARLHWRCGNDAEAEGLCRRSLQFLEAAFGPVHLEVARALGALAAILNDNTRFSESEPLARRALGVLRADAAVDGAELAESINTLAIALSQGGRHGEAKPLYLQAAAIGEGLAGSDSLIALKARFNMAVALMEQDKLREAEEAFRHELPALERTLGQDHPFTAKAYHSLAGVRFHQRGYEEAEKLCRRALEIRQRLLGVEHTDVISSIDLLVDILCARGERVQAISLCREYVDNPQGSYEQESAYLAPFFWQLASLYRGSGEYEEAESACRRMLAICEGASDNSGRRRLAMCLNEYACLRRDQGRLVESRTMYNRALALTEECEGADHFETPNILGNLAILCRQVGDVAEADGFARRAEAIRSQHGS